MSNPFRNRRPARQPVAVKVPAITAVFWLIKVLTTGAGESLSDYLANLDIALALVVGIGGFATALVVQLNSDRYRAPRYWTTVAALAVFGTMLADGVHLVGVPYVASTAFYLVVVAGLLTYWRRTEGTLSIHSITTRRRELLYWATVLATFALGTAAGDFTADGLRLGYLTSAVVFAVAISIPALAWRYARLNAVAAFWLAYIFTRPLGASIADWIGKPVARGGLGAGDGTVSLVAGLAIAALVGYVTIRRTDIQPPDQAVGLEATDLSNALEHDRDLPVG